MKMDVGFSSTGSAFDVSFDGGQQGFEVKLEGVGGGGSGADGVQVLKLVPVTDGTAYRFYDMVSGAFFDSITDTPLEGGDL
jgi:hypothetical protein